MHNPWCVKIELARGCTRRCPFCTLSTIDWKDDAWQFIKLELIDAITKDLNTWVPKVRIEMDERGEPSFHPKLMDIIKTVRKNMPKAQIGMISNGDMVDKKSPEKFREWLDNMMAAGMNVLVFDCYEEERFEQMKKLIPESLWYGFENGGNPWQYGNPKTRHEIHLLPGFWFNRMSTRKLRNQGGNLDVVKAGEQGFFLHKSLADMSHKMCTRPFREFVIHSDGTVPLCCDDWRQEGKLQKFPDDGVSLKDVWFGPKMNGYRVNLLAHNRTTQSPCKKCNTQTGFRSGLENSWFE